MMDEQARILVVDDESRGVELLVRTLRGMGEVVTADSADRGWEILQGGASFDLVVTDQRMPGMSGIELLRRVATNAPETGRILLTGYTDLEATLDAINQGQVHAYLTKPCTPPEVQEAVREVLVRVRRGEGAAAELEKHLSWVVELAKRIATRAGERAEVEALAAELRAETEAQLETLRASPKRPSR